MDGEGDGQVLEDVGEEGEGDYGGEDGWEDAVGLVRVEVEVWHCEDETCRLSRDRFMKKTERCFCWILGA